MENGYSILAKTYRQVGNEKSAKVMECLANFDEKDKFTAFDSSMFNDIVRGYMLKAIQGYNDDMDLCYLDDIFEEFSAEEAEKYWKNYHGV